MIELTRTLLRQFRAVVRKSVLAAETHRPPPVIVCRAGRQGLTLSCKYGKMGLRHHTPGSFPADSVALPFSELTKLQNAGTVIALEQTASFKAKANWQANDGPEFLEFDTAEPSSLPAAPEPVRNATHLEAGFLQALDDAARTASRDKGRYACNLILLRGEDGAVIGTDGRHLLVQKGFALPWKEEQFLPALPVYGGRELPRDQIIKLGLTSERITMEVGPWLFAFKVEKDIRFPNVDQVIPRTRAALTHLYLDARDIEELIQQLSKLPGDDDSHQPVTLDMSNAIVLRCRCEKEEVVEVPLVHARREGPLLQLVTDRRYLLRALKLGFTEVVIAGADHPLLCKDARRTYLWMPLPESDAVPATAVTQTDPVRVSRPTPVTHPETPTRNTNMPANEPRSNSEHPNGNADHGEPLDPIREAEELRALVQATLTRTNRLIAALGQQRKQSRMVESALASLRRLQG